MHEDIIVFDPESVKLIFSLKSSGAVFVEPHFRHFICPIVKVNMSIINIF